MKWTAFLRTSTVQPDKRIHEVMQPFGDPWRLFLLSSLCNSNRCFWRASIRCLFLIQQFKDLFDNYRRCCDSNLRNKLSNIGWLLFGHTIAVFVSKRYSSKKEHTHKRVFVSRQNALWLAKESLPPKRKASTRSVNALLWSLPAISPTCKPLFVCMNTSHPRGYPCRVSNGLLSHILPQFGQNTVRYGAMGTTQRWAMRQERKSRRFTTDWNQLPIAKA